MNNKHQSQPQQTTTSSNTSSTRPPQLYIYPPLPPPVTLSATTTTTTTSVDDATASVDTSTSPIICTTVDTRDEHQNNNVPALPSRISEDQHQPRQEQHQQDKAVRRRTLKDRIKRTMLANSLPPSFGTNHNGSHWQQQHHQHQYYKAKSSSSYDDLLKLSSSHRQGHSGDDGYHYQGGISSGEPLLQQKQQDLEPQREESVLAAASALASLGVVSPINNRGNLMSSNDFFMGDEGGERQQQSREHSMTIGEDYTAAASGGRRQLKFGAGHHHWQRIYDNHLANAPATVTGVAGRQYLLHQSGGGRGGNNANMLLSGIRPPPSLNDMMNEEGMLGGEGVIDTAESCSADQQRQQQLPSNVDLLGNEVPLTFPQKLMQLLSNPEVSDIATWLPHGKGFLILQKRKFSLDVMPLYFKHSKFTSFTRKLNRWGFTRVSRGPEMGAYYHKYLQRGNHLLCMQMRCNSSTKSKEDDETSTSASTSPKGSLAIKKRAPKKKVTTTAATAATAAIKSSAPKTKIIKPMSPIVLSSNEGSNMDETGDSPIMSPVPQRMTALQGTNFRGSALPPSTVSNSERGNTQSFSMPPILSFRNNGKGKGRTELHHQQQQGGGGGSLAEFARQHDLLRRHQQEEEGRKRQRLSSMNQQYSNHQSAEFDQDAFSRSRQERQQALNHYNRSSNEAFRQLIQQRHGNDKSADSERTDQGGELLSSIMSRTSSMLPMQSALQQQNERIEQLERQLLMQQRIAACGTTIHDNKSASASAASHGHSPQVIANTLTSLNSRNGQSFLTALMNKEHTKSSLTTTQGQTATTAEDSCNYRSPNPCQVQSRVHAAMQAQLQQLQEYNQEHRRTLNVSSPPPISPTPSAVVVPKKADARGKDYGRLLSAMKELEKSNDTQIKVSLISQMTQNEVAQLYNEINARQQTRQQQHQQQHQQQSINMPGESGGGGENNIAGRAKNKYPQPVRRASAA